MVRREGSRGSQSIVRNSLEEPKELISGKPSLTLRLISLPPSSSLPSRPLFDRSLSLFSSTLHRLHFISPAFLLPLLSLHFSCFLVLSYFPYSSLTHTSSLVSSFLFSPVLSLAPSSFPLFFLFILHYVSVCLPFCFLSFIFLIPTYISSYIFFFFASS